MKKRCSKCGQEKTLTEFHKDKKAKDGLRSSCKICKSEEDKKYAQDHREQIREYNKRYCKNHQKEIRERKQQYFKDHPRDRHEYNRQYAQDHREEKSAYYRGKTSELSDSYIKGLIKRKYKIPIEFISNSDILASPILIKRNNRFYFRIYE